MKSSKCFKFTGEEYFFQGHFPSSPILPGVMQVEFAHRFVEEVVGRKLTVKAVKKMKFVNVITPVDEVTLEIEGDQNVSYRFRKGDLICSSGVLCY